MYLEGRVLEIGARDISQEISWDRLVSRSQIMESAHYAESWGVGAHSGRMMCRMTGEVRPKARRLDQRLLGRSG